MIMHAKCFECLKALCKCSVLLHLKVNLLVYKSEVCFTVIYRTCASAIGNLKNSDGFTPRYFSTNVNKVSQWALQHTVSMPQILDVLKNKKN